MKRIHIVVVLILVLIGAVFFILSGTALSKETFSKLPDIGGEEDAYEIHFTEFIPRENIYSFIVDSDKIYVFYEKSALVNIYKTDGNFEYGIQISSIPNGKSGIAIDDGKLYFCSRRSIIFVFEDGKLIETVDLWSSDESLIRDRLIRKMTEQEPNHHDGQNSYVLIETENDIVIAETNDVILDFPKISNAGDYAMMGIGAIWVLTISVELLRKKRIRDRDGRSC